MLSAYLQYGPSRIYYQHYGSGKTVIIALHGYGGSAASFDFLQKHTGNAYQLIAIDLPFHGKTCWMLTRSFSTTDLSAIIKAIGEALGIAIDRFIVIGYSIGARIALAFAEQEGLKVLKLVLVAPDGIGPDFWYRLATQSWAGRLLFRSTMKNPAWLFALLPLLSRWLPATRRMVAFAFYHLRDSSSRMLLHNRWLGLGACTSNKTAAIAAIRKHHIPVRLLFGKYDYIIPYTACRHFCTNLQLLCSIQVADAGHNLLKEKYAPLMIMMLKA